MAKILKSWIGEAEFKRLFVQCRATDIFSGACFPQESNLEIVTYSPSRERARVSRSDIVPWLIRKVDRGWILSRRCKSCLKCDQTSLLNRSNFSFTACRPSQSASKPLRDRRSSNIVQRACYFNFHSSLSRKRRSESRKWNEP